MKFDILNSIKFHHYGWIIAMSQAILWVHTCGFAAIGISHCIFPLPSLTFWPWGLQKHEHKNTITVDLCIYTFHVDIGDIISMTHLFQFGISLLSLLSVSILYPSETLGH